MYPSFDCVLVTSCMRPAILESQRTMTVSTWNTRIQLRRQCRWQINFHCHAKNKQNRINRTRDKKSGQLPSFLLEATVAKNRTGGVLSLTCFSWTVVPDCAGVPYHCSTLDAGSLLSSPSASAQALVHVSCVINHRRPKPLDFWPFPIFVVRPWRHCEKYQISLHQGLH
jgi:hypothetical protein